MKPTTVFSIKKQPLKVLFAVALLLLCSLTFLLIKRISYMNQAANWVNQTNVVRLSLSETLSKLKDVEVDQRGFLLSKDSSFLDNSNMNKERVMKHLDTLRALVSDNPVQLKQADTLNNLVNKRLDLLQTLRANYGNKVAPFGPSLTTDLLTGKQVMDAVKDRLQIMENIEKQLLKQHITTNKHYVFTTPFYAILLTTAALLIILFAIMKLDKQLNLSNQEGQLAGKEAKKAGALLENAEHSAHIASWEWNLATQYIDRSDNLYRLFGYEPGSFKTDTCYVLELMDKEDRDNALQKIEQCRVQGISTCTCQFWATCKNGERRYFQCITWFSKNEKGEEIITGTTQDITEEYLLKQEAKKRAYLTEQVVEHNEDLILVLDTELRVTLFNKSYEKAFGTTRSEVLGKKVTEVFPYIGDVKLSLIKEALEGKETIRQQLGFLKDQRTGEISFIPLRDSQGNFEGMLLIVHDITELKQATELLQDHNIRFEQAEQAGNLGSYRRNVQTGDATISDNLYRLFGVEPGSVTPSLELFFEFLHPEDKLKTIEAVHRNVITGVIAPVRCRIIRKDGAIRYIKASAIPVRNEKGQTVIYGSILDVTEEEMLKQELEQRTALMESIIENTDNLISAVDTDMRYMIWNKTIENTLGLQREDVIGKKLLEVFPEVEKHPNFRLIQQGLKGHPSYRIEYIDNRSGTTAETSHTPLRDNEGKVTGLLIVSHDITERKRAAKILEEVNTELKLKNKQLLQSNEELTSFNYVASHDLQEPLRKIQTFANFLEESEPGLSEQGKNSVKRMQLAAARMRNLIKDLLAFSRVEMESELQELVDLNRVLTAATSSLKNAINEKGATIIAGELPVVQGVAFKLQQLFQNLIGNAMKYCSLGNTPVINITSHKVLAGKDTDLGLQPGTEYHHICFKDNGIGFEQQYADKIFELFQRLHTQNEYPGTGLGLAICKKIVQVHGGHILASSQPGEGSLFEIYLPVAEVMEAV
ncbi:PAS domain S-box protein [Chitinophagaceae bacterium LB-8]|uniref:histidine kinase n=1 Tax=Paraflavisolibacter caeni TaxID=2982496 RepID=A0A9X2XVA9_9BACT|nr:PAS domain S-box protein [Paraflavisolibacter caeni]MCU7549979.1 PAS domain S-box protein [Paraflavisolibacter caeni]